MTLPAYWLKARTQYGLHSPLLFWMYNELLFARLSHATQQHLQLNTIPRRERQYYELLYKFAVRYKPEVVLLYDMADTHALRCLRAAGKHIIIKPLISNTEDCRLQLRDRGGISLVRKSKGKLMKNNDNVVTLDMFHTGVVLHTSKLAPQHLLLKGWGW